MNRLTPGQRIVDQQATVQQKEIPIKGRSHSISASTQAPERSGVTQKMKHMLLSIIKGNGKTSENPRASLKPSRVSKGRVEKQSEEANKLEELSNPPANLRNSVKSSRVSTASVLEQSQEPNKLEKLSAPPKVQGYGIYEISEKSRPDMLRSALVRLGVTSLGALVRIPLSALRLVSSPFIALAGAIAFAKDKELGIKIINFAASNAVMGVSGPLTSVVEILGSALGSIVDPIVGKPIVRTAQMWTETRLLAPKVAWNTLYYKFFGNLVLPPPFRVHALLDRITFLDGIHSGSKWANFAPGKDFISASLRIGDIIKKSSSGAEVHKSKIANSVALKRKKLIEKPYERPISSSEEEDGKISGQNSGIEE